MTPEQSTSFAMRFGATLSPWWLLLALPLVALAAWWLYRAEWPQVDRRHRLPLLALRLALVMLAVLLLFRPSLVHQRTLTYPGREVLVVDDSPSMAVHDSRLTDAEALAIGRRLGDDPDDAEDAPMFAAGREILTIQQTLITFARDAVSADRDSDAFWDRAGQAQDRINDALMHIEEQVTIADARLEAQPPDELTALRGGLAAVTGSVQALFAGAEPDNRTAFDRVVVELDGLARLAATVQAELDRRAIADGDQALAERAAAIRRTPRIELIARRLSRMTPRDRDQLVSLMSSRALPWPVEGRPLEVRSGVTDLVGQLEKLADEPSDFPLASITLLSDGRDVAGRPASSLEQTLSRMQSPVLAAGVGDTQEPVDAAITGLVAAPIAVADQPYTIHLRIKAAFDEPRQARITVSRGQTQLHEEQISLAPSLAQRVSLTFTPDQLGLARYRVRIESLEGEVLPRENNYVDFTLHTRERKVGVLLIDDTPRWQTRFVLNILRRLPYVQLNPIIVTTSEGGELRRGAQRGAWPDSPAALDMYDVVIYGQIPDDLLTDAERDALADWVDQKGRTLVRLADQSPTQVDQLGDLALTTQGQWHPMTRPLAQTLPVADAEPSDDVLLVHAESGTPLLSAGFRKAGRVVHLRAEHLWEALNREHLTAHARLIVHLVTWAIEADQYRPEDQPDLDQDASPRLSLDRRRLAAGQPLVVRTAGLPAEAATRLLRPDGQTVAEARRVGAGLSLFEQTPPGDYTIAAGELTGPTVHIVRDDDELDVLSLDQQRLEALSQRTGGAYRALVGLDRLLMEREPRERTEEHERTWRLWDMPIMLSLLVVLLTVEWVWRKLVGLV